ncbi:MAG: arylsulfatase [Bacteroidales bacterium]
MKNKLVTSMMMLTSLPIGNVIAQPKKNHKTYKRPNVIFVMTDDQGKNDLACEGNLYIHTPNIDKFYSEAVRLENYHVSPTSAPTRAAIMTGRFTDRTNCFHTIGGRDIVFADEVMLPQIFAQNGYATGMFGKWHMGDTYPYRPEDRGFQEVVNLHGGGVGQAIDYWGNDYLDDTYWHNSVPTKYKGYCTDVFFGEAMKFIKKNAKEGKPFFAYITPNAPHGPLNVPKSYYDIYKNVQINDNVRRFYGMITNIDDNFAKLRQELTDLGIEDNTILVFTTDNGTATGAGTFTAGLKGHKGSKYEGGHRVPFYIYWKNGNIYGGRDVKSLTAHVDVLPTFVDLCNMKFTPVKKIDGESVKPLLVNSNSKWHNRFLLSDSQRLMNLVKWRASSLMTDKWRLVDGKELYDIHNDLGETHNIAVQHPDVVQELRYDYEQLFNDIIEEGANERTAYIYAGSPYQKVTDINCSEMHSNKLGFTWQQQGCLIAEPGIRGVYKIRFVTDGKYKITLCRYPLESGYNINQHIPAQKPRFEIQKPLPESNDVGMTSAELYVAQVKGIKKVPENNEGGQGIIFEANIPAGYYDMEAFFNDKEGRQYPAYYIYIEKIGEGNF